MTDESPPRVAEDVRAREFADWFRRQCPPGTVISNPDWWSERILRRAAFPHLAAGPAEPVVTVLTDHGLLWRIGGARQDLDSIELSKDDGKTWVGVFGEGGSVAVTLERIRAWARLIGIDRPTSSQPPEPVAWAIVDADGKAWWNEWLNLREGSAEREMAAIASHVDVAAIYGSLRVVPLVEASAAPSRPVPWQSAWVIEDSRQPPSDGPLSLYWCGFHWHKDHLQAVRFQREEDAHRAIMGLPNGWHLIGKPVEHAWTTDAVWQSAVAGGGTDGP